MTKCESEAKSVAALAVLSKDYVSLLFVSETIGKEQTSPESLSKLVFDGPSVEEDEARYQAWEDMERLGMINP